MKILICYDGGDYSDDIMRDLRRAGLPSIAEACIATAANVLWPADLAGEVAGVGIEPVATSAALSDFHIDDRLADAHRVADRGADQLRRLFPEWNVETMVRIDAPTAALLERADEWKPDLIVVGTHGRRWLGRLILGSVSRTIVTDAATSVRVVRPNAAAEGSAIRLLVAIDGTEESYAAAVEIAARRWPHGTSVSVVTVMQLYSDVWVPEAIVPPEWADREIEEETRRLTACAAECVTLLRNAGLEADSVMLYGDPEQLLLDEARKRRSDTIFLGAKRHRLLERFIFGSLSASIVTHAACSVEIVRPSA